MKKSSIILSLVGLSMTPSLTAGMEAKPTTATTSSTANSQNSQQIVPLNYDALLKKIEISFPDGEGDSFRFPISYTGIEHTKKFLEQYKKLQKKEITKDDLLNFLTEGTVKSILTLYHIFVRTSKSPDVFLIEFV